MMENLKKKLKDNIKPLYKRLLSVIKDFNNKCAFCVQIGKDFSMNEGILFVGKAVNEWGGKSNDVEILFGEESDEKIFDCDDQMEWVHECEGAEPKEYNSKKSAFWRVVKKTSKIYFGDDWYNYVAWSNLYKIAPWSGGNPNTKLCNEQLEYCKEILKNEINTLSPKIIVMLTSGWENDFICFFNDSDFLEPTQVVKWKKYETKLYKIKNLNIITSPHPQGKNEEEHVKAITKLIDNYAIQKNIFSA